MAKYGNSEISIDKFMNKMICITLDGKLLFTVLSLLFLFVYLQQILLLMDCWCRYA